MQPTPRTMSAMLSASPTNLLITHLEVVGERWSLLVLREALSAAG